MLLLISKDFQKIVLDLHPKFKYVKTIVFTFREKEKLEFHNKTLMEQNESLNQSKIDTSRMFLLGNGFVNMSGFSFMLASETSSSLKSPDLFA